PYATCAILSTAPTSMKTSTSSRTPTTRRTSSALLARWHQWEANVTVQAPSSVVMVRPLHFDVNPVTAADNVFQSADPNGSKERADAADRETTALAEALEAAGVRVHIFDDERTDRPDSVFPNNWISTHVGGHIAVYPMFAPNRRTER